MRKPFSSSWLHRACPLVLQSLDVRSHPLSDDHLYFWAALSMSPMRFWPLLQTLRKIIGQRNETCPRKQCTFCIQKCTIPLLVCSSITTAFHGFSIFISQHIYLSMLVLLSMLWSSTTGIVNYGVLCRLFAASCHCPSVCPWTCWCHCLWITNRSLVRICSETNSNIAISLFPSDMCIENLFKGSNTTEVSIHLDCDYSYAVSGPIDISAGNVVDTILLYENIDISFDLRVSPNWTCPSLSVHLCQLTLLTSTFMSCFWKTVGETADGATSYVLAWPTVCQFLVRKTVVLSYCVHSLGNDTTRCIHRYQS